MPAAATSAQLQFQLSYNTEPSYDNVIVEAHTVGADDWTTLKEVSNKTQTSPPAECTANPDGFLLQLHPFLKHYLGGTNSCAGPGTTGTWNSFTGSSDGWIPVAFDLTRVRGQVGRGLDLLRHRSGWRRGRRLRGRHEGRHQRHHDGGRLRGRDEHLDPGRRASRQPAERAASGRSAASW